MLKWRVYTLLGNFTSFFFYHFHKVKKSLSSAAILIWNSLAEYMQTKGRANYHWSLISCYICYLCRWLVMQKLQLLWVTNGQVLRDPSGTYLLNHCYQLLCDILKKPFFFFSFLNLIHGYHAVLIQLKACWEWHHWDWFGYHKLMCGSNGGQG